MVNRTSLSSAFVTSSVELTVFTALRRLASTLAALCRVRNTDNAFVQELRSDTHDPRVTVLGVVEDVQRFPELGSV